MISLTNSFLLKKTFEWEFLPHTGFIWCFKKTLLKNVLHFLSPFCEKTKMKWNLFSTSTIYIWFCSSAAKEKKKFIALPEKRIDDEVWEKESSHFRFKACCPEASPLLTIAYFHPISDQGKSNMLRFYSFFQLFR